MKEQALKCYLFTFQSTYDSLELDHLARLFEVEQEALQSSISKVSDYNFEHDNNILIN